jgi:hypothetical protein
VCHHLERASAWRQGQESEGFASVPMSRDTKWAAGVVVGSAAVILWFLWPLLYETAYGHVESEREVRDVVARVRLGATREAVERTIRDARYRKLIVRERGVTTWRVGTAPTLGASDWTLTFQFGDEGLACVVVGTADDWSRPPAGAPPAPCVP